MKIYDIVTEHKKGMKAKIYTKKGPEPRKPIKPSAKKVDEPEKIDEISGALLGRYARKAQIDQASGKMTQHFYRDDPEKVAKATQKVDKRTAGLDAAGKRQSVIRANFEKEQAAKQAAAQQADKANLPAYQEKLKQLKAKFDPQYDYSDDYSYWSQQRDLSGQIHHLERKIDSLQNLQEYADAGGTTAAAVGVGAVYKNKGPKQPKKKDGTAVNALDMKGTNLLTGGSLKRS